jgi:hypothetical protein
LSVNRRARQSKFSAEYKGVIAAAHAIGADLHALKIEDLRQERDMAARREAVLTARLDIVLKAAGLAQ